MLDLQKTTSKMEGQACRTSTTRDLKDITPNDPPTDYVRQQKIKATWAVMVSKGLALFCYLVYTQEKVFKHNDPFITAAWLCGIFCISASMGEDIQKTKQYPPDADWFDRMSEEEKDQWLENLPEQTH